MGTKELVIGGFLLGGLLLASKAFAGKSEWTKSQFTPVPGTGEGTGNPPMWVNTAGQVIDAGGDILGQITDLIEVINANNKASGKVEGRMGGYYYRPGVTQQPLSYEQKIMYL